MSSNLAHSESASDQLITRGQLLWDRLRKLRDTEPISLERAKLVTASDKKTEGTPIPLRRARAFEKIVTEIPIYIDEGQLLAGDFASRPMAAEWFPELTVEWVLNEIKDGTCPYNLRQEELPDLKDICEYWKDKAFKESFFQYLGREYIEQLSTFNEEGSWVFAALTEASTEKGWNIPDYPKAIRMGFSGIIAEIREELSTIRPLDDKSLQKKLFLQALIIMLKAGIRYGKRYAKLARELAKQAQGKHKEDLERIATVCERVPEKPARNFHEAVQTTLFCHLLAYWDLKGTGVSLGRVDQYLYPYFQKDQRNEEDKREDAIEILECLRVKLSSERPFQPSMVREGSSGETQFHNCTLGGQNRDGKDAVNTLSFLWLEAAYRTRTPHPTLSVRWHQNLSPEFAIKAAELCREGMGYPAWFGDKASIKYLMSKLGVSVEEARDYAMAGCVVHVIPHRTAGTWPTVLNMPKILEITLNNGKDPRLGVQVGLQTGDLESLATYKDLTNALQKQVSYFLTISTDYLNNVRLFRAAYLPDIFVSALFDDCIERGETVIGGGARYQTGGMYLLPIGVVDVGDSLATVKKYIYDESSINKQDLMQALADNFEGHEEIRQCLMAAPKYGNDENDVDNTVRDLYNWLNDIVGKIDTPYGAKYVQAPHNLTFHGAFGRRVGALPNGRMAGVALADGAVSPCQGVDCKGPTAVINSAGKINHVPILGTLFNMKFHPSSLKNKEDLTKFLMLIRTYFDNYEGKHMQFNVLDKEMLIDAQSHPEHYRNLVVRVSGYSALWVELDSKIQNEIIARTGHSL